MKKLMVFLAVLIMLLPLTAFAEESAPSSQEETPVEVLLRNQISLVQPGSVLLIGGNASEKWQDFKFDMYPYNTDVLTLKDTLSADWISGVSYLARYLPEAVIFCLDGNDTSADVTQFINSLASTQGIKNIYFVSAFSGNNLSAVNQAALEGCSAFSNTEYVDVYSIMLTEDGTVDPAYIGDNITAAGLRLMGETVCKAVNIDMPVIAPSVSVPDIDDTSGSEEAQGNKKSSYRWLIPVAILAVGLIIGVDCARTAQENEKRRKARNK